MVVHTSSDGAVLHDATYGPTTVAPLKSITRVVLSKASAYTVARRCESACPIGSS